MKTKQEIIEFLKECVDQNGTLDLSDIDTTTFAESVDISEMKVKRMLIQDCQEVGESLLQGHQRVGCNLMQHDQQVGRRLVSHKLRRNEKWKTRSGYIERVKKEGK